VFPVRIWSARRSVYVAAFGRLVLARRHCVVAVQCAPHARQVNCDAAAGKIIGARGGETVAAIVTVAGRSIPRRLAAKKSASRLCQARATSGARACHSRAAAKVSACVIVGFGVVVLDNFVTIIIIIVVGVVVST
jgi:hypothetical protein